MTKAQKIYYQGLVGVGVVGILFAVVLAKKYS